MARNIWEDNANHAKISHLQIKFGLHAIFNKFPGIYSLAVPNREDVNVLNKNPL